MTENEKQKIVVFQQNGSGEKKIRAIREREQEKISLSVVSIDGPLPPVIDNAAQYLPETIDADMVLDFLKHPDLSQDLALRCVEEKIPVVASGKKMEVKGVHTPPT